jgi:hypothetical protein
MGTMTGNLPCDVRVEGRKHRRNVSVCKVFVGPSSNHQAACPKVYHEATFAAVPAGRNHDIGSYAPAPRTLSMSAKGSSGSWLPRQATC